MRHLSSIFVAALLVPLVLVPGARAFVLDVDMDYDQSTAERAYITVEMDNLDPDEDFKIGIHWGDATDETLEVTSDGTELLIEASHTYPVAGHYVAEVCVEEFNGGETVCDTVEVNLAEVAENTVDDESDPGAELAEESSDSADSSDASSSSSSSSSSDDSGNTEEPAPSGISDDSEDDSSDSTNEGVAESQLLVSADTSGVSESSCQHDFDDVGGHWSEAAICYLAQEGVVQGRSFGQYEPNASMTRAEFLKVLLLSLHDYSYDKIKSIPYGDVASEDWFAGYILYATDEGVVEGYTDGLFRPHQEVTRAEAIIMLSRLIGYTEGSAEGLFDDVTGEEWFAGPLKSAVSLGLIEGYEDSTFRPHQSITRAEAAVLIKRTIDFSL